MARSAYVVLMVCVRFAYWLVSNHHWLVGMLMWDQGRAGCHVCMRCRGAWSLRSLVHAGIGVDQPQRCMPRRWLARLVRG